MPNSLGVTAANMFATLTGRAAPPAPVAPNPSGAGNPGNIPPASTQVQTTPGNPTAPVPVEPVVTEVKSPLDGFSKLWDTDPNAKKLPPEKLLNIDAKQMMEHASKVDFRTSITPELQLRMKAGGEDGMAAMMEAMNGMSQTVYANAATAAATIVEEAGKKIEQQINAKIPALLRKQNTRAALQENPILSHPAISPVVSSIASQLQVKHPTATPAQLTEMAQDLFMGLATSLVEHQKANDPDRKDENKVPKESDFSNW